MNKTVITKKIIQITNEVIEYVQDLSDNEANLSLNEKWSVNGNLEHLILSIQPLTKALKVPKIVLKWKFGKMQRVTRTYDELLNKYNTALGKGFSGTNPFEPNKNNHLDKNEIIALYQLETKKLIQIVEKWSEKQLDTYVLPHPLIGKLSIREMLYFTHLHTNHHFKIIKNIDK